MNTQIVAEIGQAHDGSLGILYSLIDAAVQCGVDAVKFQMHIAEAESSEHEEFRVRFSREDRTRYDYWKRMEFTESQWADIKTYTENKGVEFLCTPFSCQAVDRLERLGVQRYKVGSAEVSDKLLLSKIGKTGKPVIMSSGMSDYREIDDAIALLNTLGLADITLMQCTTEYPTSPEKSGLNVMQDMSNRYGLPIGFSDHSGSIYIPLAAAARGASIVEVHITFDKNMFGPDASSSLCPDELAQLVTGIRTIERSLNHPVDKDSLENLAEVKKVFGKSLAINKPLKKDDVISFADLETKKPSGMGIDVNDFDKVVGKQLKADVADNSFLNKKHIRP